MKIPKRNCAENTILVKIVAPRSLPYCRKKIYTCLTSLLQLPCIATNNRSFASIYNIMTKSNIILEIYDQQFEVPSINYDLLARCVTAPLSEDSQVKKLTPSNFLPNIFTFTGHVKTEKLICKSAIYVQCSKL